MFYQLELIIFFLFVMRLSLCVYQLHDMQTHDATGLMSHNDPHGHRRQIHTIARVASVTRRHAQTPSTLAIEARAVCLHPVRRTLHMIPRSVRRKCTHTRHTPASARAESNHQDQLMPRTHSSSTSMKGRTLTLSTHNLLPALSRARTNTGTATSGGHAEARF